MTITIYELLGMIKDDKAPKRIMYNDIVWDYIEIEGDYRSRHNAELFLNDEINNTWIMTHLNTTAEIIEEHKIPEKINWKEKESMAGYLTKDKQIEVIARRTEHLKKSINEILDYLEVNND